MPDVLSAPGNSSPSVRSYREDSVVLTDFVARADFSWESVGRQVRLEDPSPRRELCRRSSINVVVHRISGKLSVRSWSCVSMR